MTPGWQSYELYIQSTVSSYVIVARYRTLILLCVRVLILGTRLYIRKAVTQIEAELGGLRTHRCHHFPQNNLTEIASQTFRCQPRGMTRDCGPRCK